MNMQKAKALALGVIIGLSVLASPVMAKAKHSWFGPSRHSNIFASHRGGVLPPFAYIQFCTHHASACADKKGKLAMVAGNEVKLNAKLRQQIISVNAHVNRSMIARSDKGADKWSVGGRYGDCEDFAMTKRAMLIAQGWPSRALSLTVVKTAWGEGHAILSVHTSSGTLVLDNLSHSVKPLSQVPYHVVAMQENSAYAWGRPF